MVALRLSGEIFTRPSGMTAKRPERSPETVRRSVDARHARDHPRAKRRGEEDEEQEKVGADKQRDLDGRHGAVPVLGEA